MVLYHTARDGYISHVHCRWPCTYIRRACPCINMYSMSPVQPLYNARFINGHHAHIYDSGCTYILCTYVCHYEGVDGPMHVAQMDIVSYAV